MQKEKREERVATRPVRKEKEVWGAWDNKCLRSEEERSRLLKKKKRMVDGA